MANLATDVGLPRDAIRNVLIGHDPRLSRAAETADALDLHFCIGFIQDHQVECRALRELQEVSSQLDRFLTLAQDEH